MQWIVLTFALSLSLLQTVFVNLRGNDGGTKRFPLTLIPIWTLVIGLRIVLPISNENLIIHTLCKSLELIFSACIIAVYTNHSWKATFTREIVYAAPKQTKKWLNLLIATMFIGVLLIITCVCTCAQTEFINIGFIVGFSSLGVILVTTKYMQYLLELRYEKQRLNEWELRIWKESARNLFLWKYVKYFICIQLILCICHNCMDTIPENMWWKACDCLALIKLSVNCLVLSITWFEKYIQKQQKINQIHQFPNKKISNSIFVPNSIKINDLTIQNSLFMPQYSHSCNIFENKKSSKIKNNNNHDHNNIDYETECKRCSASLSSADLNKTLFLMGKNDRDQLSSMEERSRYVRLLMKAIAREYWYSDKSINHIRTKQEKIDHMPQRFGEIIKGNLVGHSDKANELISPITLKDIIVGACYVDIKRGALSQQDISAMVETFSTLPYWDVWHLLLHMTKNSWIQSNQTMGHTTNGTGQSIATTRGIRSRNSSNLTQKTSKMKSPKLSRMKRSKSLESKRKRIKRKSKRAIGNRRTSAIGQQAKFLPTQNKPQMMLNHQTTSRDHIVSETKLTDTRPPMLSTSHITSNNDKVKNKESTKIESNAMENGFRRDKMDAINHKKRSKKAKAKRKPLATQPTPLAEEPWIYDFCSDIDEDSDAAGY